MKKILFLIVAGSLSVTSLFAQGKKCTTDEGFFVQLQGGAAYTVGSSPSFWKLVSPNAAVSAGYYFNPILGLRLNANGWEGKGYVPSKRTGVQHEFYGFKYLSGGADVMVNLAGFFGNKRHTINPYVLGGVGLAFTCRNKEAVMLNTYPEYGFPYAGMQDKNFVWVGRHFMPNAKAGLGVDFDITRNLSFNLESNCLFIKDNFNSKKDHPVDMQVAALAGLTWRFGKCCKSVCAAPVVPVAPVAPAPEPVKEEVVVEPAPAPAPAPVVEEVEEAPKFEGMDRNILFVIGKWSLKDSEMPKFDEIVAVLKANPDTKIMITGHADKATGTKKRNQIISEKRCAEVASLLEKAGIAKERIMTQAVGDTDNQFPTPEENRVAICVVK